MAKLYLEKRGKKWQYSFYVAKIGGKRKRISKCGFDTKTAAERAGTKAAAEYFECGVYSTPSQLSYADFLEEWLQNYCKMNLKETSYRNYAKRIRLYINPKIGAYKLSTLNAHVLQGFINDMTNESFSRNTLSVLKGILSGSLNHAVQQGLIKFNPMYTVKLPSPRNEKIHLRSKPNTYIPQEHIAGIFERFHEGTTAHLPLMIGYKCGLRIGEVFALTWDCVDFENQTINIEKQVQWDQQRQLWYFSNPKYDSFRVIDIDTELTELLRKTKERQERAKALFQWQYIRYFEDKDRRIVTDSGKEVSLIMVRDDGSFTQPRIMQHASSIIHHQLGYKEFTFHSLRHTHSSILDEAQMSPKYIQNRLGHSDIKLTVGTYQHLTEKIANDNKQILESLPQVTTNDSK